MGIRNEKYQQENDATVDQPVSLWGGEQRLKC